MLELNEEARRLTSTFLAYRNEIDIYTEDEEKDKEFYKVLFKRLVNEEVMINDITPLGDRDTVIRRCFNEPENGRKKIFIVDGDIQVVNGKKVSQYHKNLFILDAYCIENFLIDLNSITNFIYLNCAVKSREEIVSAIDHNNWLNVYMGKFIELFVHFAIADFFGLKFTLFNANKYHNKTSSGYVFAESIVSKDVEAIKKHILTSVNEEDYMLKYVELTNKWVYCIESFLTIVSGKDYLIPILQIKAQEFKKSKALASLEEVKMSLAHFCDLSRLDKLKRVLKAL